MQRPSSARWQFCPDLGLLICQTPNIRTCYLCTSIGLSVSGPRRAVIGRQRRDVIVRRKCATGHVLLLLLLLLCDVIVSSGRQVVVMQQPLQVTDVVNSTPQRLHL